jgi:Lon protease-like protein
MNLPLFPLGTVLFPGGVLPLRIFETRYLDMVRACMSSDSPFGVCLITRGAEVGSPAEHESIGCTARIVDFDMESGGVLQLRTVGIERFEVIDRSTQPDGLIRATVRAIAADPPVTIPESLAGCSALMRRVIEDVCRREADPARRVLAEPFLPEDAGWVANRLCELLPLAPGARQLLMSLGDPLERLEQVAQILAQGAPAA